MVKSIWSGLAALCLVFSAAQAQAEFQLGLDAEAAFPLDERGVDTGWGGALRGGYKLDLFVLQLTPEIGLGYHNFGGSLNPSIVRPFVGARLSLGQLIRPGVFAHIGYGNISYDGGGLEDHWAPMFDMGATLDLTFLPVVDLGVHVAYNYLAESSGQGPALDFITLGAHIAFAFDDDDD